VWKSHSSVSKSHLCVCKSHSACGNNTRACRAQTHACGNHSLHVEITLERVFWKIERVLANIYLKNDTHDCEFHTRTCHFHTFSTCNLLLCTLNKIVTHFLCFINEHFKISKRKLKIKRFLVNNWFHLIFNYIYFKIDKKMKVFDFLDFIASLPLFSYGWYSWMKELCVSTHRDVSSSLVKFFFFWKLIFQRLVSLLKQTVSLFFSVWKINYVFFKDVLFW
jgi:hypothetical protein